MALKCSYTNCLSLFNKLSELRQHVHDICPHVVALTETWLTPSVSDGEVSLVNFNLYRTDSCRSHVGGVAVYLHNSLPPASLCSDFPLVPGFDTIWLIIPLRQPDSLMLGVVYRSPSTSEQDNTSFICNLEGFIRTHVTSHLLIMGDFNAPKIDWPREVATDNSFSCALLNLTQQMSWAQHVDFPTRSRPGQTPSLLDLVITNESHFVDAVEDLPPLGKSDHHLLSFDFICYWSSVDRKGHLLRNFSRADIPGLLKFLNNIALCDDSVETDYRTINRAIIEGDRVFIPRKPMKTQRPPLPRRIRRLLDIRSRLFAKQRHTMDPEDILSFRQMRNLCKGEIRRHNLQLQTRILKTAKGNRKCLFQYMRRRKKHNPTPFSLKQGDGDPISDPLDVAEAFRSFFSSIFSIPGSSSHPILPQRSFVAPLNDVFFGISDVERLLANTNPYSAMGPDGIHPRILKEAASALAAPLCAVYRSSLFSGILPQCWKEAIVTPIFKKGSRHLPSSYRPISLTSIPCKLLERIIRNAILEHLLKNELISRAQHGFLPGRSCITNMLIFMDSLTEARDHGLISDAVFFDFAKAFDRVPHIPLLHKLTAYGIGGNLHEWIRSFLDGRSFRVRIGSTLSSPSPVRSGVPQGSVLGPLLFLIYVNDLPDHLNCSSLLYADDLKIWSASDPNNLQMDVDTVKRWSEDWDLPINDEKCTHMSFGGDSGNAFVLHDESKMVTVPKEEMKKDLGIWLSSNLSFSHHHQLAARRGFSVWCMIRRAFQRIDPDDFRTLFGVYVRPLLEYASQVVHTGLRKDTETLEKVQRSATKSVRGLRDLPYADRLKSLNLYPFDVRRLRGDLIFTYVMFAKGEAEQFFTAGDCDSLRGHNKKLFVRRANTSLRQRFFSYRVVTPWNSLPSDVVNAGSLCKFKLLLDVHLNLVDTKINHIGLS